MVAEQEAGKAEELVVGNDQLQNGSKTKELIVAFSRKQQSDFHPPPHRGFEVVRVTLSQV